MTQMRDDERHSGSDPKLSADDAVLIDRMRSGFGPAPLGAVRSASFDARLRDRLERRSRRPWAWAALTAATAAALIWAVLPGELAREGQSDTTSPAALAWEQEVMFGDTSDDPFEVEGGEPLPPEYMALASAFEF